MAEKVQDWKDWNGIKWEEGDFILAERMNLLQDNVQSLKDTIDIHNLLVENSDGTWNIAETRDVIMNVLTVAPSYDDLQFPVNEGDYCWHEGSLYCANTDIATAEAWTAAHWDIKPIGDDVIAAYERIDEIQKSAEIQTLGSLENRVGVLENNTVNKWESFPANTVIPEGTYCIYENKIYYAINDFTKTSSEDDNNPDDSNPSSSHFCIEVANTTVRPKKIQIDDSAIETKKYSLKNENIMNIQYGYAKIIHIDKTELYNHGKIIYITTTNHSGSFFAAALLNINPLDNSYSYLDPETGEENIVNFVVGKNTNVIVFDTVDRDKDTRKYRKLDITAAAQEKIRPAEITNNFYLLLYYGNNSPSYPNEPSREEILKDISIYYGVGTTQEQLDDLSARIDTTALEDSIEEIRNQIGATETDTTLWEAVEANQQLIDGHTTLINANKDNITSLNGNVIYIDTRVNAIENKIGNDDKQTTLIEQINEKANQSEVNEVAGQVNSLIQTVQGIQTSFNTISGNNLEEVFNGQFGLGTNYANIWALLKAKINSGDYSQIRVGDYVTLKYNNIEYNATVAGINFYTGMRQPTLTGSVVRYIKKHIDFICDRLWEGYANDGLKGKQKISQSTYDRNPNWPKGSSGISPSDYSEYLDRWTNSYLYGFLNKAKYWYITSGNMNLNSENFTTGNSPLELLGLKNIVSDKYGYIDKYDNTGTYWINFGKLWLPTELEITGQTIFGAESSCCSGQYPLFQYKRGFFSNNSDVTDYFYTLTKVRDNTSKYVAINRFNLSPQQMQGYTYLNFPICFRIEADS